MYTRFWPSGTMRNPDRVTGKLMYSCRRKTDRLYDIVSAFLNFRESSPLQYGFL